MAFTVAPSRAAGATTHSLHARGRGNRRPPRPRPTTEAPCSRRATVPRPAPRQPWPARPARGTLPCGRRRCCYRLEVKRELHLVADRPSAELQGLIPGQPPRSEERRVGKSV